MVLGLFKKSQPVAETIAVETASSHPAAMSITNARVSGDMSSLVKNLALPTNIQAHKGFEVTVATTGLLGDRFNQVG